MADLLEQLKRLILDEKKDLSSKEVVEISHLLDQKIVKEMKLINKGRLKNNSKKKFISIKTKRSE